MIYKPGVKSSPEHSMSSLDQVQCRWHRSEFSSRMSDVIQTGRLLFRNTAITDPRQLPTPQDMAVARQFLTLAAPNPIGWPETGTNWLHPKGPLEHITLTAAIAAQIAEKLLACGLRCPTPETMTIVGLFHDLGRLICHDFYITDMLSGTIATEIGISAQITRNFHKIEWYWNIHESLYPEQIPFGQRISVIADVMAKRSSTDPSRLRRPSELLAEVQQGKEKYLHREPKNSTDYRMREILPEYARRETTVLTFVLKWLKHNGVDLSEIMHRVERELLTLPSNLE